MDMEHEEIRVRMFGQFAMSGRGAVLDEDRMRSGMLMKLMAYLLCHRAKEVSTQELIEALWGDADSDNPAGALKNLVYRLRTMLKKTWADDEFIVTGRGTYRVNGAIPLVLDTEEFEKCCRAAERASEAEEKIRLYMEAAELYKGMFLPNAAGEYWAVSLATYFHSLYLTTAKELAHLLEGAGRYGEMGKVCSVALKMEPLEEDLYCLSIRALQKQNKLNLAKEQYQKAVATLYENLGISPSKNLRKAYEELLKQTHEEEMSLQTIKAAMDEEKVEGAFLCEYGVFRKMYQLEKRRAERLGLSEYLALVTVAPYHDLKPDSQAYLDVVTDAMRAMEKVLLGTLRAGDVITKYSGSQYMILLPTCQYETAKVVMKRIEMRFAEVYKKKVRIRFGLEEMGLLGMIGK